MFLPKGKGGRRQDATLHPFILETKTQWFVGGQPSSSVLAV